MGSILTDFSAQSFGVNFSTCASERLEMRIKKKFRLSVECLTPSGQLVPRLGRVAWQAPADQLSIATPSGGVAQRLRAI